MPKFFVRVSVQWPADGDVAERERLIAKERARVRELVGEQHVLHLWRVTGRWENLTIWRAADREELEILLDSLPFRPWLEFDIEQIEEHPSDPDVNERKESL